MLLELFLGFLEVSVHVGLLTVFLLCLTPFLSRFLNPAWKYWVWLFVSVRLLLPFGPSFLRNLLRADTVRPLLSAFPWVLWVWTGGIAALSVGCMVSYLRFKRLCLRWSMPVSLAQTQELVSQLHQEMEITRPIPIAVSMKVSSPLVIGLFSPMLFLPHENYPLEDITCILRHELLHYKRHDIWYKLLLLSAGILHWFNPVVWLMGFQASCDLEILCDQAALKNSSLAGRHRYSSIILNTNHATRGHRAICTTHFYGGASAIRQRLNRIADTKVKSSGVLLLAVVLVFSLVCNSTVTYLSNEAQAHVFMPSDAVPSDAVPSDAVPSDAVPSADTPPALPPASEPLPPAAVAPPVSESSAASEASSTSASSSAVSSSEASSSGASSGASSQAASSKTSSLGVSLPAGVSSSAEQSTVPVVKQPGVLPERSVFLFCVQDIVAQYAAGTVDTTMKDLSKGVLMPLPAGVKPPPAVQSVQDFSVSINKQGYGIVLPFAAGGWQMHIWVQDNGPADAYALQITAVSFVQTAPPAVSSSAAQQPEPPPASSAAEKPPAASSSANISAGKPKSPAPKKSGLLG